MKNNLAITMPEQAHNRHYGKWGLRSLKGMVLLLTFFWNSLDGAAQDVRIGGTEPERTTQKNAPPTKPAPSRQEAYGTLTIVPDEDCLLIVDGARQKDTLRAGKSMVRSLAVGTHRLSAESIATGYLLSQRVRVDARRRMTFEIRLKEAFDAHLQRVETALLQQQ